MSDSEFRSGQSGAEPRLGGGERPPRQEPSLGGVSLLIQARETFQNPNLGFEERHMGLVYARKTLDRIKNQKIAVPSSFDLDAYVAELTTQVRQVVLSIPYQLPAWTDLEGEGDYGVWDFCTAAILAFGEYGSPQDEEARATLLRLLRGLFPYPESPQYWARRWPGISIDRADDPLSLAAAEAICRLANPQDIPLMIDVALGRRYYSGSPEETGNPLWLRDRFSLQEQLRDKLHLFGQPIIPYVMPLLRKVGHLGVDSPAATAVSVLANLGEVAIPEVLKATYVDYHADDSEAIINQPQVLADPALDQQWGNYAGIGVANALWILESSRVKSQAISHRLAQIVFEDDTLKATDPYEIRLTAARALATRADVSHAHQFIELAQEAIASDDRGLFLASIEALRLILNRDSDVTWLIAELDRSLGLLQTQRREDYSIQNRAELILGLMVQLKRFDVVERVYAQGHRVVVINALRLLLNHDQDLLDYDQDQFSLNLSQGETDRLFEILVENCDEPYHWAQSSAISRKNPESYRTLLEAIANTHLSEAYDFLTTRLQDNHFLPISRETARDSYHPVALRNETVMAVYAGLSQLRDPRVLQAYIDYFDYFLTGSGRHFTDAEVHQDFWRRTTDMLAHYGQGFITRLDWETVVEANELRPTLTKLRTLAERLETFAERFYPDQEEDDEEPYWEVAQVSEEVGRWQVAVQDASEDIDYLLMI